MTIQERLELLNRISEVAALAGLSGAIDDNGQAFQMGFELNGGRSQVVQVRPTMTSPDGKPIVTIQSPCLVVKKGMLSSFPKDKAVELLQLNESIPFARYGLVEGEDAYLVVASIDHLLDTLDPDELHHSAWCVASAADNYEQKSGQDVF